MIRAVGMVVGILLLSACGQSTPQDEYRFTVSHRKVTLSEKRGVVWDVEYTAELWPDPEIEDDYIGRGYYSGKVYSFDANCDDGFVIPTEEHPAAGSLEASGVLYTDDVFSYNLVTLDWRYFPFPFAVAQTREELEMVSSFGSVSVLVEPVTLDGDLTRTERTYDEAGSLCDGRVTTTHTISVTRTLIPREVEARPWASRGNYRGELTVLDGSRSTPRKKLTSYEWILKPGPGCPPEIAERQFSGETVSLRVLCEMEAVLTVSDGRTEHTASAPVKLVPRPWKTSFTHREAEVQLVGLPLRYPCLGCTFGRNVCALDGLTGSQTSGHFIHGRGETLSWEGEGFELAQVQDEGSPFNGWWYVAEQNLALDRASLINSDLSPGSDVAKTNHNACSATGMSPCDFDTLAASVRAHERTHSALLQETLAKEGVDPTQKLEALIAPPNAREALLQSANLAVGTTEQALMEGTSEEHVRARLKQDSRFNRGGAVLLPDGSGAYESWVIENFAELGTH